MTHTARVDRAEVSSTADEQDFATLGEIYARARERLLPEVWEALDGGAGDEQTLRDNVAAIAKWSFRPRYLNGIKASDVGTRFLGLDLALPVLTAPIGGDGIFHAQGQCAIAEATAEAGTVTIVSEASPFALETVAAASSGPKIMQLMAWGEPEQFLALARRAVAAGYAAVCVTIDCPTLGWRERPMKNRFTTPGEQWSGNYPQAAERLVAGIGSQWTWETFTQVRAELDVSVLAKGVMTAEDATAAVECGADGVVVSNHGGRQLDCLPATLDQLPEIADAVGGRVPVAFDGGIRRGADVLKALALGADVVCVGRLAAMALAAGGAPAVLGALELLRAELERSMLLVGCRTIADVDRTVVQPRLSGGGSR